MGNLCETHKCPAPEGSYAPLKDLNESDMSDLNKNRDILCVIKHNILFVQTYINDVMRQELTYNLFYLITPEAFAKLTVISHEVYNKTKKLLSGLKSIKYSASSIHRMIVRVFKIYTGSRLIISESGYITDQLIVKYVYSSTNEGTKKFGILIKFPTIYKCDIVLHLSDLATLCASFNRIFDKKSYYLNHLELSSFRGYGRYNVNSIISKLILSQVVDALYKNVNSSKPKKLKSDVSSETNGSKSDSKTEIRSSNHELLASDD